MVVVVSICIVTSGPQSVRLQEEVRYQGPLLVAALLFLQSSCVSRFAWLGLPTICELNLIATLYLRKIYNWKLSSLVPLFISRNLRKYGHFGLFRGVLV